MGQGADHPPYFAVAGIDGDDATIPNFSDREIHWSDDAQTSAPSTVEADTDPTLVWLTPTPARA